jgi:predicted dehydrogenase
MAKRLRVVHVGCGGMAKAWLGPALGIPGLEVVGLVDLRESAAEAARERFGLGRAETGNDLRAMLRAVKPDIVFDATVPEAHCQVTLEALRHGCHVLGEKPLADNMANARRMVTAARKARRLFAITQNYRYNPGIAAYRKLIGSRKLGDLTTLNVDFYLGPHFRGFRARMKHVLLVDMAIHTFDAMRFLSGKDPVAVTALDYNPKGSWYSDGASAVAAFEMTGGVVATYRGSWCAEGLNTSWNGQWRAVCRDGTALWDGAGESRAEKVTSRRRFVSDTRTVKAPAVGAMKRTGHAALIHEFVRCVRTGERPRTEAADNVKSLAMVFGAIESAETGRRVRIRI